MLDSQQRVADGSTQLLDSYQEVDKIHAIARTPARVPIPDLHASAVSSVIATATRPVCGAGSLVAGAVPHDVRKHPHGLPKTVRSQRSGSRMTRSYVGKNNMPSPRLRSYCVLLLHLTHHAALAALLPAAAAAPKWSMKHFRAAPSAGKITNIERLARLTVGTGSASPRRALERVKRGWCAYPFVVSQ